VIYQNNASKTFNQDNDLVGGILGDAQIYKRLGQVPLLYNTLQGVGNELKLKNIKTDLPANDKYPNWRKLYDIETFPVRDTQNGNIVCAMSVIVDNTMYWPNELDVGTPAEALFAPAGYASLHMALVNCEAKYSVCNCA